MYYLWKNFWDSNTGLDIKKQSIKTFSNSGINKVAMVKNALLPMSLYSLLCVNEIIRYHLHIVDRSTMCKWNHKVSFTHSRHEWCNLTNFYLAFFLLMSLLENATSPWGQSWERVLHKHSCIHHSTCAFGTRAVMYALVLVQNPFPRLSPWRSCIL